jgi:hypothetical protein
VRKSAKQPASQSLNSVELAASAARRAREKEIQDEHSAGTVTRKDIKWKIQKMALQTSAKIHMMAQTR